MIIEIGIVAGEIWQSGLLAVARAPIHGKTGGAESRKSGADGRGDSDIGGIGWTGRIERHIADVRGAAAALVGLNAKLAG